MQTLQADYFATYRNLKLSRDAKGVLVAEFHSDGGIPRAPSRWNHARSEVSTHGLRAEARMLWLRLAKAGGKRGRVVTEANSWR
jgi:hypothetical protein